MKLKTMKSLGTFAIRLSGCNQPLAGLLTKLAGALLCSDGIGTIWLLDRWCIPRVEDVICVLSVEDDI